MRDGTVVATVAGTPITVDQVAARLGGGAARMPQAATDSLAGMATMQRWAVQELVDDALIHHEAQAAAISVAAGADLRRAVFQRVTEGVSVSEADVSAYYRRNVADFRRPEQRMIRHIVVRDRPSAETVLTAIRHGKDFGAVAARSSLDRWSAADGGRLVVRRGELAGPLEEAIFAAAVHALLGPIQTEHGWHVVRVDASYPASTLPLSRVRATIAARLIDAARSRAFARWLDARRRQLAWIDPRFEHPAHPVHGAPHHRH